MTDPAVQQAYDRVSARHRAEGDEITRELHARLREVAARRDDDPPAHNLEGDEEVPGFRWDELP
jgi:hypothetical protein